MKIYYLKNSIYPILVKRLNCLFIPISSWAPLFFGHLISLALMIDRKRRFDYRVSRRYFVPLLLLHLNSFETAPLFCGPPFSAFFLVISLVLMLPMALHISNSNSQQDSKTTQESSSSSSNRFFNVFFDHLLYDEEDVNYSHSSDAAASSSIGGVSSSSLLPLPPSSSFPPYNQRNHQLTSSNPHPPMPDLVPVVAHSSSVFQSVGSLIHNQDHYHQLGGGFQHLDQSKDQDGESEGENQDNSRKKREGGGEKML